MPMWLPSRILLRDLGELLVAAWKDAFSNVIGVEASLEDFFAEEADAIVSPANSFGIMDGGLDLAIRHMIEDIEDVVRTRIAEKHSGELPVGSVEIVTTNDRRWPYMICAPTMRIPESIGNSINPYLAFRATLIAIANHNRTTKGARIDSVVVPGLGTGVGGVKPIRCARLMRLAYDNVVHPTPYPSPREIRLHHQRLLEA